MKTPDQKDVTEALKQASIVMIGAPLVQMVPFVGPLIAKLPSFTVMVVQIPLAGIVAGAVAVIVGNLGIAMLKK